MERKENSWFPSGRDSCVIPASAAAGSDSALPPPLPPDPPDPLHPSYLCDFPPLSPIPSPSSLPRSSTQLKIHPSLLITTSTSLQTTLQTPGSRSESRSETATVPISATVTNSATVTTHGLSSNLPLSSSTPSSSIPSTQIPISLPLNTTAPLSSTITTTSSKVSPNVPRNHTLADKLRKSVDRSLSRQAPSASSSSAKLIIPDSVFQVGAQLHKNFIVGKFLGRPPPYTHIQNVLSNMWNKGIKMEIHLNTLNRTMLVRITNDFIRSKILEKKIWHISDSMFYVYPWCSGHSTSLDLEATPIWAHISGIPLELMHHVGWGYLAGQIGEPKEVDDYTLNLVSIDTAHVKVEADLTKPLPLEVEYFREDGSVHKLPVTYPWVPPTCSHCKELGHVIRYCHHLPPPSPSKSPPVPPKVPNHKKTQPTYVPKPSPSQPQISTQPLMPISSPLSSSLPPSSPTIPTPPSSTLPENPSPIASISLPTNPTPQVYTPSSLPSPPLPQSNPYSILASLTTNSCIPPGSSIPFLPSSIPFFPSSDPSTQTSQPSTSSSLTRPPDSPLSTGVNSS